MKINITMMIVLVTILVFITACSSKIVLPPKPVFSGDCRKDLDGIVKYYVVPIEVQRR